MFSRLRVIRKVTAAHFYSAWLLLEGHGNPSTRHGPSQDRQRLTCHVCAQCPFMSPETEPQHLKARLPKAQPSPLTQHLCKQHGPLLQQQQLLCGTRFPSFSSITEPWAWSCGRALPRQASWAEGIVRYVNLTMTKSPRGTPFPHEDRGQGRGPAAGAPGTSDAWSCQGVCPGSF